MQQQCKQIYCAHAERIKKNWKRACKTNYPSFLVRLRKGKSQIWSNLDKISTLQPPLRPADFESGLSFAVERVIFEICAFKHTYRRSYFIYIDSMAYLIVRGQLFPLKGKHPFFTDFLLGELRQSSLQRFLNQRRVVGLFRLFDWRFLQLQMAAYFVRSMLVVLSRRSLFYQKIQKYFFNLTFRYITERVLLTFSSHTDHNKLFRKIY